MKKMLVFLSFLTLISCASGPKSESTGEYIDSAAITSKIKTSLIQDARVSALDVKVKTYKGIVQLSGFVETEEQKEVAEEVAHQVNGVLKVENNLIVKE